jgi:crotonobetainyl-CoA:carnitine CoA-transferase CaiB-like acyl-CoA transferase
MSSQPLSDIKVLDLSRVLAAPFAGQMLSDLGAEVIKVEALGGDDTRTWGTHYFRAINRGKKSIAVNLKDPRGQAIVRRLALKSDVLLENYKVGDLARYGLDHPTLAKDNPGLIYLSITGFGQTGPRAAQPGYDTIIQGMTGIMTLCGEPDRPPARAGLPMVDIMSGMVGTVGILSALHERARSGLGQRIDLSLFDVGMMMLVDAGQDYLDHDHVQSRLGGINRNFSPGQPFQSTDGWVTLAVPADVPGNGSGDTPR